MIFGRFEDIGWDTHCFSCFVIAGVEEIEEEFKPAEDDV